MSDLTYYQVLGVPTDASTDDIKKAHRKAMRALHPDMGGEATAGMAVLVNQAKDVLTNDVKRIDYDKKIGVPRQSSKPAPSTSSSYESPSSGGAPRHAPPTDPTHSVPIPEPTSAQSGSETTYSPNTEINVEIRPRELKWWFGVISVFATFFFLWLAAGIAGHWTPTLSSDPGILAGIGVTAAVGASIYGWKSDKFPAAMGILAVLVVIGYCGHQIYQSDPLPHPATIAAVAALSVLAVLGMAVFTMTLRDIHGRRLPGVKIMPDSFVRDFWAYGHVRDSSLEEPLANLGTVEGIRLFHNVRLASGEIAETVAYCNDKALMIEFIPTTSSRISWDGSGIRDSTGAYARLLFTPPPLRVNARGLGCKTFATIVVLPDGVEIPNLTPRGFQIVPFSEMVRAVDTWAGPVRKLNRKTMARVWGSVVTN